MADELVDKGIDADEIDGSDESPGRRKVWWLAAGAVLAAVVGTLAVTRPWSNASDEGDRASVITVARPADVDPIVPELTHHLALGVLPEGYELSYVSDGETDGFDEFADSALGTYVLLAAPGASSEDGPWLSVAVTLLDKFERREFDPTVYISAAEPKEVRVGELRGAFAADNFSGNSELLFGPVNEGYLVSLSSEGLTQAELTASALELQLDEEVDGTVAWPVFGPSLAPFDLQPVVSFVNPSSGFGIGGPFGLLATATMSSTEVAYESAGQAQQISVVNSVAPAGLDVLALARFAVTDAVDTTVHGFPAVSGRLEAFIGGALVAWLEGGRTVIVFSADPDIDIVALAESVEALDDAEWTALVDEGEFDEGGFDGGPDETWVIGVGDAADSTTWVIEGDVDEAGKLVLCTTMMRVNESSSGCGSYEAPEVPGITLVGDFGMGGRPTSGYVATVDNDTVATFRFTGEDGAVEVAPLAVVRPEWPFQAAALYVEQPGVIELLAADGSVLVSLEITQDDLDGGGFG